MATRDRPDLAHRASHMFLAQDYPGDARLLVFDDGRARATVCQSTPGRKIEVVVHSPTSLPRKRNEMVAAVTDPATIFVVWDDDDGHGRTRIRKQVETLIETPYVDWCLIRPWVYYDSLKHHTMLCMGFDADATLAFRRSFWERRPWDETIDPGSGPRMLRRQAKDRRIRLAAPECYTVVRHDNHRTAAPNPVGREWAQSPWTADDVAWTLRTAEACPPPRCG